jgi:hypothetical protein
VSGQTYRHQDEESDGSCAVCCEDRALNGDDYTVCETPELDAETTALLADGTDYCYCGHALDAELVRHTYLPEYRNGKPCCDRPASAHPAQLVVENGKTVKRHRFVHTDKSLSGGPCSICGQTLMKGMHL